MVNESPFARFVVYGGRHGRTNMKPWRCSWRHLGRAVLAALLLTLIPMREVAAQSPADDQDYFDDLLELDIAELLDIQLGAMAISGIHHTHDAGEWMLGYSYIFMGMAGNRSGTHELTPAEVLESYMVAPTAMDMQMHMGHFMYAPTDWVTLMGMVPYVRKTMDHEMRNGNRFSTRSGGLGDVKVSALANLYRAGTHRMLLDAGLSLPTGSIDVEGLTPMGRSRLPYPMQLGSGTFDLLPGFTYLGQTTTWAWGAHTQGTVRLGENHHQYRLGHRFHVTSWAARKMTGWLSSSVRVAGGSWGNVHGADSSLNAAMIPTADPELRAGQHWELLIGANFFALGGRLKGNRVALEWAIPLYQNLEGPQLETGGRLSVAWDLTFE